MASAAEAWVRAQLLLRCLQHPGWEVVVGGFGQDFALLDTGTGRRVTVEVKSRQDLEDLTQHPSRRKFRVTLSGAQASADYLVFLWFDRGLTFIIPTKGMASGVVGGSPTRRYSFSPTPSPWLNAWDQLFAGEGVS